MPTYDYECSSCGHRFELFQSMTAKVKRKCPECARQSLQRLIGPGAGFLFKGDGFYITDYRSSSYKEGQKSETSSSADKTSDKTSDKSADKSATAEPSKASESKKSSTDGKTGTGGKKTSGGSKKD